MPLGQKKSKPYPLGIKKTTPINVIGNKISTSQFGRHLLTLKPNPTDIKKNIDIERKFLKRTY